MNVLKRALVTSIAIAGMMAVQAPAQAATVNFLQNWTLDLSNVAGQGLAGSVTGIDFLQFSGLTHVQVNDLNHDGAASAGDTFQVTGLLATSTFNSKANGFVDGLGLNGNPVNPGQAYEMTGKFTIDGIFGGLNPNGTIAFTHPGSGSLDLYIDNLKKPTPSDTSTKATPGAASGYTDGTKVASFIGVPNVVGTGGAIDLNTSNGNDNAYFKTTSVAAGVFQNALAQDLGSTLSGVMTKSNLISNSDFDTPSTTAWEAIFGAGTGKVDALDFFVHEDGSANIVTPEPGTIVLLGAGLFGLAVAKRRRQS